MFVLKLNKIWTWISKFKTLCKLGFIMNHYGWNLNCMIHFSRSLPLWIITSYVRRRGHAFETLRSNPEGRGFASRWTYGFISYLLNLPNTSSRTMVLKFTQPLTKISTRNCFWGVKGSRSERKADNLIVIVCWLSRQCEILYVSQHVGLHELLRGQIFLFILSRIPRLCGVTNKLYVDSDWIPDLFAMEIYSCTHYNYWLLTQQLTAKYRLSDSLD
jgi:hypothetical protein